VGWESRKGIGADPIESVRSIQQGPVALQAHLAEDGPPRAAVARFRLSGLLGGAAIAFKPAARPGPDRGAPERSAGGGGHRRGGTERREFRARSPARWGGASAR